jgi:hypothetical protein
LDSFEEISGKEDKMIDVSNIREDGTGIRTQAKPATERGQKVFLEGIPILSKNVDAYLRALKILFDASQFDSVEDYEKTVKIAQAKFASKQKSRKS